ncbi:MAG: DUF167 domain-containing protein [Geopsychrobacter sp.]|nr:DUF167 domain-containing protein [Geopsychrobacter sp.]
MIECLKEHPGGTIVSLHVQPRSSRNQIVGLHGDSLKIKLTSPPVEGAANKCCREYLAKLFKLPKSDVELLSGDKARQKRILLHGLDLPLVESVLKKKISGS